MTGARTRTRPRAASAGSPTSTAALTFAADRRRRRRADQRLRASAAGPAGSGTEGWPLCGGRVVPLIDTNMIIEYSHRILAAAVTVTDRAAGAVPPGGTSATTRLLVRVSFAALRPGPVPGRARRPDGREGARRRSWSRRTSASRCSRSGCAADGAGSAARERRRAPSQPGATRAITVLAVVALGGGAGDDRRRRLHVREPAPRHRRSTRRSTRTWPAATTSRPAAASSCRSAAAARSTSTSPTARSCTWPRRSCSRCSSPSCGQRRRLDADSAATSWRALGRGDGRDPGRAGAARRAERLARRARVADRRPPDGRDAAVVLARPRLAARAARRRAVRAAARAPRRHGRRRHEAATA